MGVLNSTVTTGKVLTASKNTKITNLNITSTGSEFNHNLTANTKQLIIKSRVNAVVQLSFTSGQTNTIFYTIPRYNELNLSDLDLTSKTVYVECDKIGVLEIIELY